MFATALMIAVLFTQSELPNASSTPASLASTVEAPPSVITHFTTPRGVGVHAGIGPGTLAVDVRRDRFYAMFSSGIGTAVLSDGKYVPFVLFAGAQFLIDESPRSAWYFDLGVIGGVTIQQVQDRDVNYARPVDGAPYPRRSIGTVGGGVGVGFGFRYEHISGLSVGIKLPVFGANFGYDLSGVRLENGLARVGYYWLMAASGVPVLSLGYRF